MTAPAARLKLRACSFPSGDRNEPAKCQRRSRRHATVSRGPF